jgi:hypothetical protein
LSELQTSLSKSSTSVGENFSANGFAEVLFSFDHDNMMVNNSYNISMKFINQISSISGDWRGLTYLDPSSIIVSSIPANKDEWNKGLIITLSVLAILLILVGSYFAWRQKKAKLLSDQASTEESDEYSFSGDSLISKYSGSSTINTEYSSKNTAYTDRSIRFQRYSQDTEPGKTAM